MTRPTPRKRKIIDFLPRGKALNAKPFFTPAVIKLSAQAKRRGLGGGYIMTWQRMRNVVVVARTTIQFGWNHGWSWERIHRAITLCIMCILAESGALRYANRSVPASAKRYHEAMGQDHDSVGLQQQRYPMWGPLDELMDPVSSTVKFLRRLENVDWDQSDQMMVQSVQVSWKPDGSNYGYHRQAAIELHYFVYDYAKRTAKLPLAARQQKYPKPPVAHAAVPHQTTLTKEAA